MERLIVERNKSQQDPRITDSSSKPTSPPGEAKIRDPLVKPHPFSVLMAMVTSEMRCVRSTVDHG